MLLRRTTALRAGFSSAAFTGADGGEFERLKKEQERLKKENTTSDNNNNNMKYTGDSAYYASFYDAKDNNAKESLQRPTRETYEAMTTEALLQLLDRRETQIKQLRSIYENFHYQCDKNYRKMIFDYHDKAAQLSQVHGRMQAASIAISRDTLMQLREEQEMYNRDKRLIFAVCVVFVVLFWVWVRRHYISRKEVMNHTAEGHFGLDRMEKSVSVLGAGSYGGGAGMFGKGKRSARTWETDWEREVRERKERETKGQS
ncbi:hypothetical protein, conserved [Angomonas deanei]|uniref:Uncharacterized protein n=1 Tax=Angomonas deanei TaxID=59799 RepID=A0A7G2CS20_9TRYP|nr:hypothetical protein, conserved [Angomonas deanei]